MEILKVIRGLRKRDSGSSERVGFGARLSLRLKSLKASLVSLGSASAVKGREGGLLIQEGGLLIQGGDTGHREGSERVRQGSFTREGQSLEGKIWLCWPFLTVSLSVVVFECVLHHPFIPKIALKCHCHSQETGNKPEASPSTCVSASAQTGTGTGLKGKLKNYVK